MACRDVRDTHRRTGGLSRQQVSERETEEVTSKCEENVTLVRKIKASKIVTVLDPEVIAYIEWFVIRWRR